MFCTAVATSRPSSATSSTSSSVNASASSRESEIIPIGRAPSRSGASSSLRRPSSSEVPRPPGTAVSQVVPDDDLAAEHALEHGAARSGRRCRAGRRRRRRARRSRSSAPSSSSTSTIAMRSNGMSPRTSRMNAPNACSISSDDPSARAERFAASSTSTRRPSASRSRSASAARSTPGAASRVEPADEPADDQAGQQERRRTGTRRGRR